MTALLNKLAVLADAAKYDASCASSGTSKRDSKNGHGIGSSGGMGICHSYAPDGRCISLLKILLTNFCIYDCQYCVNRASSPVQRARFTVEEVAQLTIDFYKRNYIEGLFLSSGIIQSSDYTMEQLVAVAKILRKQYDFKGYIHLKTIPDAAPELLREAGLYADRLSINIELPSKRSLAQLAPEKSHVNINESMIKLKDHIDESKEHKRLKSKTHDRTAVATRPQKSFVYAPAGQSTQMIVGADATNDTKILTLSGLLYDRYRMRRVYYSAYSPIPSSAAALPAKSPPLLREHRLYQADWLLRFYGFNVNEIAHGCPESDGMLDLDVDPKLAWALKNRAFFPVNVNKASKEALLRIPGLGTVSAGRILKARRFRHLRLLDLKKCGLVLGKAQHFLETVDHHPQAALLESPHLKNQLMGHEPQQLSLFS